MDSDEDIEKVPGRPPADEPPDSEPPVAPDSGESAPRVRPPVRPGTPQDQSMQRWSAFTATDGSTRRGPSYPAWEKPPSQFIYPRLRGQEERRTMRPLIFAAIGVVLVVGALVVGPALLGRPNKVPAASASAIAVASNPIQPTPSVVASQGNQGTPVPFASYQQYQVQTGDSLVKIARKFHLQSWELLLANPQITDPNNVKWRSFLNIPRPGQLTPPASASPTISPIASAAASVVAP